MNDILEREFVTGVQRCSRCERETVHPLEDGLCAPCLGASGPAKTPTCWRVDVPRSDGSFGFSLLFPTRDAAEAGMRRWPGATLLEAKW